MKTFEKINSELLSMIPKDQWHDVYEKNKYAAAEIDGSFVGFVDTYYYLSLLIPKDWTVIDIGCAYNAQCYFFKEHSRIISVQPNDGMIEYFFKTDNCEIYRNDAKSFISDVLPTLGLDFEKTFAICNYVPDWYKQSAMEIVRENFKNLYCFYPK